MQEAQATAVPSAISSSISLSQAQLDALIDPIVAASLSGKRDVQLPALSRRYVKFYEELGEVSEAYLDVIGAQAKGKTHDDVLEEQVDAFIVIVDIVLVSARREMDQGLLPQDALEQLTLAMKRHLAVTFSKSLAPQAAQPWPGYAFEQAMQAAMFYTAGVHAKLGTHASPYALSLMASQHAYTLLFQDSRGTDGAPIAEAATAARLEQLIEFVKAKTSKWVRGREAGKSAI